MDNDERDDYSLDRLFEQYRREPNAKNREALFFASLGRALQVARIAYRRGTQRLPWEDLKQEAMRELLVLIDRFDPNRGVRFGRFLYDSLIKVLTRLSCDNAEKRCQREIIDRVRSAIRKYELAHGKAPELDELVETTGYNPEQIRWAIERGSAQFVAIEKAHELPSTQAGPEALAISNAAIESVLAAAREVLTTVQFQVVVLHYLEDLPFDVIATRLNISAQSARKIASRSIKKLRCKLEGAEFLG